jgi:clorobiocin biosynthesis protein CloN5
MEIESEIIEHIRERFLPDGGQDLTDSTPILELGILDSFSMMKLVDWIEQRYSLQIESKDVAATNFS